MTHQVSYTKKALAQLYYPHLKVASARNKLMHDIRHCRALHEKLTTLGMRLGQHQFTIAQVKEIFYYLGEP